MKLINNLADSATKFKDKIHIKAISMNKNYEELVNAVEDSIEGLDDMIYWLEVYKNDTSILTDIEVYNTFRGDDDEDLVMAKHKLPDYLENVYDDYRRMNPIEKPNTRSSAEQRINEHIEFLTEILEVCREHKDILDSENEKEKNNSLTFEDIFNDINQISDKKIDEHCNL